MSGEHHQHNLDLKRSRVTEQAQRSPIRNILIALAVIFAIGAIAGLALYAVSDKDDPDSDAPSVVETPGPVEPSETSTKPDIERGDPPATGTPFLVGEIMYTIQGYDWVHKDPAMRNHDGPVTGTGADELLRVDLVIENTSDAKKTLNPSDIHFLPGGIDEEFVGEDASAETSWVSELPPGQELNTAVFFEVPDGSITDSLLRLSDPSFTEQPVDNPQVDDAYVKGTVEVPLG